MDSRAGLTLVVALAACGGGGQDKPPPPSVPPIGKLVGALLAASDTARLPWRCAATDVPTLPDEDVTTGDRGWLVRAQLLKRSNADPEVVIGVIADAGGAAPRTIATLGRLRAAFDAAKADLVLALGGMGTTSEELQATLGTLSDRASWPVVALPGDLEPMTAHLAAVSALRKRGDIVLDGRRVRWIDLGAAMIGTVPGAGALERLAAGADGCSWQAEDVVKVATEITGKPGVRIVASAEAPRETIGGEAAGELALAPSKALPIEIALHGPLEPRPTPARHGGRDGAGIGLSPGTSDATPRLPGAHQPAAGVLIVRGTSWSWKPIVDAKSDDK